jgi:hypothetical protein
VEVSCSLSHTIMLLLPYELQHDYGHIFVIPLWWIFVFMR